MAETLKKLIIDIEKGTETYIDLTPAEIAERDQQSAEAERLQAERKAKEEADADAKLSAQAKLQALGLSGEEVAALTE